MGWRGWQPGHEQVVPKKKIIVMEKYIEDARQEEKDVPDLLEAIMRPTDPVKEELRQNLFKMTKFRPEITKIKVSTFGFRKSDVFPPEANARLLATRF